MVQDMCLSVQDMGLGTTTIRPSLRLSWLLGPHLAPSTSRTSPPCRQATLITMLSVRTEYHLAVAGYGHSRRDSERTASLQSESVALDVSRGDPMSHTSEHLSLQGGNNFARQAGMQAVSACHC